MDKIDWLYLVSRWLHLSAAMVAIGGAAYARLAVLPALRGVEAPQREPLRESLRRRWAPVVHAAVAVLLLTGAFNFVHVAWPPKVEPMPYHAIFGVKLLAALAIFVVAVGLIGRTAAFARMRAAAARWLTVVLVLAGVVVMVSGVLNQIRLHAPKPAQLAE